MDEEKQKSDSRLAGYFAVLTGILGVSYGFSLLARFHWFFDLFSHFAIQYLIGGLVLGIGLALLKSWRWAALAGLVFILSFAEFRFVQQHPWQFLPPDDSSPALTVVQYNKLIVNPDTDRISAWLSAGAQRYDLVVLQEAGPRTAKMAEKLGELYPYQIQEPRDSAFGMVILSRYPFTQTAPHIINGPLFDNLLIEFALKPPEFSRPVKIFALHAVPPVGKAEQAQRNMELRTAAGLTRAAEDTHVILMGDWNTTPFSPYFQDLLHESGLNYQSYGFLPQPTWPSDFALPPFKIPIDHVLFGNTLEQVAKKTGPAMGSDHHPLVVSLKEVKDAR